MSVVYDSLIKETPERTYIVDEKEKNYRKRLFEGLRKGNKRAVRILYKRYGMRNWFNRDLNVNINLEKLYAEQTT